MLVQQLDYYFSDANWTKDEFMQQAADADGYIKMSVLSSFQVITPSPVLALLLSHVVSFVLTRS